VVDGRAGAEAIFRAEGCSAPRAWGNAPGARYGVHSHDSRKVLFCLTGSITFHLVDGDVELSAGDRLDLPPGTEHSATVGADGVECIEAFR
ncbi:MAG TPA: cupin domain-containing protein, partial [Actinomycetota bacterium]